MIESILNTLKGIPQEFAVMIMAALPVSELRGAIPLGLSFGMPVGKVFLLSVIGNFSFVVPVLFLLNPLTMRLRKFKPLRRFFAWQKVRTKKKAELIQKYESLGLFLFVAIPLPMTGAWTGAIAASLFKIKFRYAITAITCGILLAGVVVTTFCLFGISTWRAITS